MMAVSGLVMVMALVPGAVAMRLEPGGAYTHITLAIDKQIPDHNCLELLDRIQVLQVTSDEERWKAVEKVELFADDIKCFRSHAREPSNRLE